MLHTTFRRLLRLLLLMSLPAAQAQPSYVEGLRLKGQGRPNLILIVAGDLGRGDLGSYGPARTPTPNIDRLATEGVRFTHYYAGSPMPAASRASMLTGADSRTLAQTPADTATPIGSRPTLASLLQAAGYVTGAIGTWGLGADGSFPAPNRAGFNEWFGYLNPDSSQKAVELWRNERSFTLKPDASGRQPQDPHELILRATLNFIRVNKHRPFFLYFAPPSRQPAPSSALPASRAHSPVDDEPARALARLDDAVGKILQVLGETALDEETFVFLTGDSGPRLREDASPLGSERSRPFRGGMGQLHEGGLRIPMFVRAPGRTAAGSVNEVVWAAWDLLPTLADLAKTQPEIRPGQISMVATIHGRVQTNIHSHLYWELPGAPPQQAVRMANWKAIRLDPAQPLLLYDLQADPGETNNLASRHPDVCARMLSILDARPGPGPNLTSGPPSGSPAKPSGTSPPR